MSELPQPGKVNHNTKLKWVLQYPSELDLIIGSGDVTEYVAGTVQRVSVSGIGYKHSKLHSISSWNLGKTTLPSDNQVGTIVVSENHWVYVFLRWLAASDAKFDLRQVEIEEAQNPNQGQWKAGMETYIGCQIEPYEKEYTIEGHPFATFPFMYDLFKFSKSTGSIYIGAGLFNAGDAPTPETEV